MQKVICNYIDNSIHNTTAKICEDVAQPHDDLELKEPAPIRRCARLVVIAVAGALLVAAIVVLATRIPKIQTEKRTFSTTSTNSSTAAVDKLLRDAVKKNQNINCPCQKQVMSWCNVTTFHLYRAKTGASITDILNLTNNEGGDQLQKICHDRENNTVKQNICVQVLGPVLNSEDSRTFPPTASAFISPDLLYKEIALRIDTNAYEQSNAFYFLEVANKTKEYNHSIGLARMLREMQFQFLRNYSSSAEDYWDAAKINRRDFGMKFSYGMEVSWETYLQTCKPAFCDVEFEVSGVNRVVRAIGQVGGITTIITLALKFLIWPSLRFALNFPTSKSLSSTYA